MSFAIAQAIIWFGDTLTIMLIVRAVLSWLPMSHEDGIFGFVFKLIGMFTEPFVRPFRWIIQRSPLGGGGMMIDFSPLLTLITIRFLTPILVNLILSM
ncbi:MAG: YggT family protein [Defluviitaleaceae bacterium]|nr:YggT family protein [Defluviitaleaceae bacterium]